MASDRVGKIEEREKLKNIINQWNVNRLDIFSLSEPNEDLEFHGAMRFYFQDAGQKVATKCIRVSSTATTSDVIQTLIEKFRPDIRMLSIPEYALYEIHENGEERKLRENEMPLWVQLDWHKDDREGRFLLRRMDEKSYISSMDACDNESFKRKLSKREKKDKKRKEKREKLKAAEESKKDEGIAERLYSELPETSFTRSISNPEAVMRRRRHQILERKLKQFCQEGGTDAGGTLRIFGESLNKDVPYKTLLLSTKDTASYVVKEILEKYGYDKEDPVQYCLVQVIVSPHGQNDGPDFQTNGGMREYILDDDDCPLTIQQQHNRSRGTLTFHVRRRPADYQPRKRKKKPKPTKGEEPSYHNDNSAEKLPYLLELNPDGSEPQGPPTKHRLFLNVTEVGSERSSSTGGQYLQLFGPNVQPRHCVIAHTERIVTVTPSSRDAETYVNNMRIYETTILQNGMVVRFGKLHTFRFVDPLHDQKHGMLPDPRQHPEFIERSRREDQLSLHHHGSYETTFDADGNVETVSTHSRDDRLSKKSDDALSHRSLGRESTHGRGSYDRFEQKRGNDPILPAVLEFWEEGEDAFLAAAITNLDPSQVQFKLSPTYALYMAARYRASTHFRPETTPNDRAHRLTALMNNVATVVHQVIQDRYRDASALAFWLANSSELLHFLKQDRHLSAYTLDAQDLLAESVQLAFRNLITCHQVELQDAMPSFLEDREDTNEEEADVLAVLESAMSILRRCRVNAALTIQMFSQLFHFINMWLFNKVVCEARPNLCTRQWGIRLKRRLGRVEAWSEKQGLELAADCHLSRIVQAAHLLQAPKSSSDDLASISSLCFKLNSLQLQTLLERYQPSEDEPHIPREFIESVVKVSENTADELARSEGREVKLEEDSDLQLPFLLPEDGYSCDIVRGVPAGLQEFLQPLIQAGLCRLTIQPTSSGYWTIYMSDQDIGRIASGARSPSVHSHGDDGSTHWKQGEPEVVTIRLQKSNNGIGLSIVAAGGTDKDQLGIYVRSVVKGGAADLDGRLQAGDHLLKVDGHSLIGVNQEKAAELMTRTGPVVTLEVAKQGAVYNGVSDLLCKPSPIIQRGPRRMSERDIPSRVMNDHVPDNRMPPTAGHLMQPRMQSSKSVPSLNSNHDPEPTRVQSNGPIRPHDVYNPGYSRTSSTASIPKATEYPDPSSRSKSTNNLRQDVPDPRVHYVGPEDSNPPPYPGPPDGPMANRPLPHPNMPPHIQPPMNAHHSPQLPPHTAAGIQEERHYQNISMYQQQPPVQPHIPPQQNVYAVHNRPAQPHPQQPPRSLHSSQSSLNRPDPQGLQSPVDRTRPMSTLVSPREQEQYANSMGYVHPNTGPPRSPKGSTHSSMDSHHDSQTYMPRPLHDQRDFRSADQLRPSENDQRPYPDSMSHPDLNQRSYAMHNQDYNMMHIDPRQRDLLRQEAKMEEMREEVRRREDRERLMLQQQMQQQHPVGRGGSWSLPRGPNPAIRPPPSYHHGPPQAGHPHPPYSGAPPPPAPKPRPQFYSPGNGERFQRPPNFPSPHENSAYQDGLQGGHLPPQVGPRMNHQPPPVVVSYRYGPTGYPPRSEEEELQKINRQIVNDPRMVSDPRIANDPRMGIDPRMVVPHGKQPIPNQNSRVTFELPQGGGHDKKESSNLMSPSPWEREEKEKLHKQRLEEARRARDEEIRELESRPHLSPQQEDRLRALRLEQEFQRRAEELPGEEEDDDDEDLLDRAENRERKLKMQEDLERARQRRLEWEMQQTQNQMKMHQQMGNSEEWKKQQQSLEEQEGRLRHLRLEEVQRKMELEMAKNAEERLLREARRRQDEFKAPSNGPHQIPSRPNQPIANHQMSSNSQQSASNNHQQMMHPSYPPEKNRLDNSNHQDIPPPLPTSPPPIEPSYQSVYNQKPASMRSPRVDSYSNHQNSDKMLEPPAPPTRKSSYEVTNQMSALSSSNRYVTSSMRNCDNGAPHYPKKVSFNESSVEAIDCDANGNHDENSQSYTLDDINEVLSTPHNSQNLNTYNPGNTPGVIGTQEVYRDPRQRIEAERNHQDKVLTRNPGPEKLTFKEKMKMFAQEVGEPETPKDKVKISRAQRDIETNLNGS